MPEIWDYVSTLLWPSAADVPKAIGLEWTTLVSLSPAVLLWIIRRLRHGGWRSLVTLPERQRWFTDIGLPVLVWGFLLLVIFGWNFLAAATKHDTEQRTQITEQKTQIAELTKTMVSIECEGVALPILGRAGNPIAAVYLHPNIAIEQLPVVTFNEIPGKAIYWPSIKSRGLGYRCEVINEGSPLSKLRLELRVDFGSTAGKKQYRSIGVPLLAYHNRPMVLHIVNCTAWSPHVFLPETGIAQVRGTKEERKISISLSARGLGSFGRYPEDSPQNAMFCGIPT